MLSFQAVLACAVVLSLLFAAEPEPPTWTNHDVIEFSVKYGLLAVIAVVSAIAAGIWQVLRYLHAKRSRDLKQQNQSLRGTLKAKLDELDKLKEERLPRKAEFEEVRQRLKEVETHADHLRVALARSEDTAATREHILGELQNSLSQLNGELSEYDRKLRATANRVRRALKLEGLIWEEKVLRTAPRFRPLSERRSPFISVLNLKGGVGKTTVTANLGAMFAAMGYRALLVDLDLQGSLTGLFLPEEQQQQLYQSRALLQDFFNAAEEAASADLLNYCQPILDGNSALAATADTLGYTELNLTFKWLLRMGKRDPRFLLRRALHLRRVTNRYDIVLLDCPPLMNVSCVNALAASDYVLIPVMPSRQATGRVPSLLKMLKSFRENINPQLKILGVLANRTSRSELTADEMNRWSLLRDQCKDQWGEPVPMCTTTIRQSTEIREIEDERRPLGEGDEMGSVFLKLAEELERHLPSLSVLPARRLLVGEAMP